MIKIVVDIRRRFAADEKCIRSRISLWNGRKTMIRGANWHPDDQRIERILDYSPTSGKKHFDPRRKPQTDRRSTNEFLRKVEERNVPQRFLPIHFVARDLRHSVAFHLLPENQLTLLSH
jgi:integrase